MKRRTCVQFPVSRCALTAGWICTFMFAVLLAQSETKAEEAKASDANLSSEMAELFDLYCLQNYPDIVSMDRLARQRGDTALLEADLPTPGKMWIARTATGRSVVSGMAGPLGGCSVRRMTPQGLPDTGPFLRVVNAWIDAHHLKFQGWAEPMRLTGMTTTAGIIGDEAGNRVEIVMLSIVTLRPGEPQTLAAPGDDGSRVEVYLGRGRPTLPVPKLGPPR